MNRSLTLLLAFAMAGSVSAQRPVRSTTLAPDSIDDAPIARSAAEKKILATLDAAAHAGETYENVPATDGRMLRLLAEAVNAQTVVEIGTSTGLSGLWLSMALEKTGGHLTTFEYDPGRAAIAKKHFSQAGVEQLITIVQGDAHKTLARLQNPIDLAFIDADKDGYVDYLNKLLPLLRPGGLLLAHNVDMVPSYVHAVTTNPNLDTVFYMQGNGLAITLKKR
jgi:caffeoyl-CoA O-methyltransferase